jgi:hypothetical protein
MPRSASNTKEVSEEADSEPASKKQKFSRSRTACLQVTLFPAMYRKTILKHSADHVNPNAELIPRIHVQIVSKRS